MSAVCSGQRIRQQAAELVRALKKSILAQKQQQKIQKQHPNPGRRPAAGMPLTTEKPSDENTQKKNGRKEPRRNRHRKTGYKQQQQSACETGKQQRIRREPEQAPGLRRAFRLKEAV